MHVEMLPAESPSSFYRMCLTLGIYQRDGFLLADNKGKRTSPNTAGNSSCFCFRVDSSFNCTRFSGSWTKEGNLSVASSFFSKPSPVALLVMDTVGEAGDEMRRGVMRAGGSERE